MAYDSNLAETLAELHDSRQRRNELETQLSLAAAEIAALKLVADKLKETNVTDLTTREYLGVACAYLRGLNSPCRTAEEGERAAALLEADAQALVDVRTLDDWVEKAQPGALRNYTQFRNLRGAWCVLIDGNKDTHCPGTPAAAAAARAKAAEWVRAQTSDDKLKAG